MKKENKTKISIPLNEIIKLNFQLKNLRIAIRKTIHQKVEDIHCKMRSRHFTFSLSIVSQFELQLCAYCDSNDNRRHFTK